MRLLDGTLVPSETVLHACFDDSRGKSAVANLYDYDFMRMFHWPANALC